MSRIELADVITSLRVEINRAWATGQYDAVGFEAGAIEIELTTEVEVVEEKGKIQAKFWVLGAEIEAGRSRKATQRISLVLTPKDRREPARPLLISGSTGDGERRPQVEVAELKPEHAKKRESS